MAEPGRLPPSILFNHTETCLTVYDVYPKAIFHFLVLPRVRSPMSTADLTNLRSLLRCHKDIARGVLQDIHNEAECVKMMIQDEMLKRYGFQWDIWMGFHAIPSLEWVFASVHLSLLTATNLAATFTSTSFLVTYAHHS